MKAWLEQLISKLPYIGRWRQVFLQHSTPGDWGSPIPDWSLAAKQHPALFAQTPLGIALDLHRMRVLAEQCAPLVLDFLRDYQTPTAINDKNAGRRYSLSNDYYLYYDAVNLYAFLRHFSPKQVIEIGSGFSSALMVDVNESYFHNHIKLHCIEPNPERLLQLVRPDQIVLTQANVQDIDVSQFTTLNAGDMLFVDSSHVSKMGSDLNYILFDILPLLKPGVLIHFHDVCYPFEYPDKIVQQRYAWNEAYLLRAFLMYNQAFDVEFMNSYLQHADPNYFAQLFNPDGTQADWDANFNSSVWLRKR